MPAVSASTYRKAHAAKRPKRNAPQLTFDKGGALTRGPKKAGSSVGSEVKLKPSDP